MRPSYPSKSALLLMLLACLCSCSGSSGSALRQLHNPAGGENPAIPATQNSSPLLPALPSPAEALAELRSASAAITRLSGGQYEAVLANENVVIEDSSAVFSPSVLGSAPRSAAEMAYAIYRMNVEGLAGDPLLRLISASPNFSSGTIWIALSDWERGSWSFAQLAQNARGGFSLDASAGVDANGDVLVAVILLGSRQYELLELSFDDYDEVEDNDSTATAQELPGSFITGFRGSMGSGEGYSGFDGDDLDVFAIPYSPGEEFSITYNFNKATGELAYTMTTQDSSVLVSGTTENSFGNSKLSFGSLGELEEADYPLLLSISPQSGFTDYSLDISIGDYPNAEFTADVKHGDAPLAVNFDASASTAPNSAIALYRWDIRSTDFSVLSPADFQFTTSTPEFSHVFTEDGLYKIDLTVYNSAGFNNSTSGVVMVGGIYDETEDNDSEEQANELDPLKADGWFGSMGEDGPFASQPNYDGDSLDYAWINVPQGSTLVAGVEAIGLPDITIIPGFDGPNLDTNEIYYPDNRNQVTQLSDGDQKVFIYFSSSQLCDYKLTWAIGTPPTLEVIPDTTSGESPLTVNFSTVAADSDGSVARIVWDYDDDEEIDGEGASISHVFESDGPTNHFGTAVVIDNDGMKALVEYTITTL